MTTTAVCGSSSADWLDRAQLEDAIRRARASYTADDVLGALGRGDAQLTVYDEGFIVWQVQIERGIPTLFVWLIYGTARYSYRVYEDFLVALARACSCERVRFATQRHRAWRRVLGPQWRQTPGGFLRAVPEGHG